MTARVDEHGRVHLPARLLRALITRSDYASIEYVAGVIWGDGPDGWPDDWGSAITVVLHYLRSALVSSGVTVQRCKPRGLRLEVPPGVDMEAMFRGVRDNVVDRRPIRRRQGHAPRAAFSVPASISR